MHEELIKETKHIVLLPFVFVKQHRSFPPSLSGGWRLNWPTIVFQVDTEHISRRLWLSHYVNSEKVRWKPKIFNIKFPQLATPNHLIKRVQKELAHYAERENGRRNSTDTSSYARLTKWLPTATLVSDRHKKTSPQPRKSRLWRLSVHHGCPCCVWWCKLTCGHHLRRLSWEQCCHCWPRCRKNGCRRCGWE